MATYYDILEISPSANTKEIKSAYRRLALRYHPDRNRTGDGSGDGKMKEINFIYSILSNPLKRTWYDSTVPLTGNVQDQYNSQNSSSDKYCTELNVRDSRGLYSTIKVGDLIYYLVKIDKSIITWKYKQSEYFGVSVSKIFDSQKERSSLDTSLFESNKTPFCKAQWGDSEILIYKEDFESYWISNSSFKQADKQKGYISAVLILLFLCLIGYYFYEKFSPSPEKLKYLASEANATSKIIREETAYLKNEFFATDLEVKYLLTGYYTTCTKDISKTSKKTDIMNIPTSLGLSVGYVPAGENVTVLLYCQSLDNYKIKFKEILGWVPGSRLTNPVCGVTNDL